ncbi:MAG: DUF362 domain-containing protein [Planctomycetia bacterium]|nr:MAG: DUF362 domain-containing protein [Planctomycetia bacterium]
MPHSPCKSMSRRQWLRAAAFLTVGAMVPRTLYGQNGDELPVPQGEITNAAAAGPWWMQAARERSRVVLIDARRIVPNGLPTGAVAASILGQGVELLTHGRSNGGPWDAILEGRQRVLITFSPIGASELRTNAPLARALVRELQRAGREPGSITLLGIGRDVTRELGCRPPPIGWGGGITVAGQREQLAQAVLESDAILNVGVLRTHRFAGMSGCLLDLAMGVVRRPARYFENGCSPHVGEIVASREIAGRLRLNILNAMRVVFRGGPEPEHSAISDPAALLLSFDPVAVDFMGMDLLMAERRRQGLSDGEPAPHLQTAEELGLGRGDWQGVERVVREFVG